MVVQSIYCTGMIVSMIYLLHEEFLAEFQNTYLHFSLISNVYSLLHSFFSITCFSRCFISDFTNISRFLSNPNLFSAGYNLQGYKVRKHPPGQQWTYSPHWLWSLQGIQLWNKGNASQICSLDLWSLVHEILFPSHTVLQCARLPVLVLSLSAVTPLNHVKSTLLLSPRVRATIPNHMTSTPDHLDSLTTSLAIRIGGRTRFVGQ